MAQPDKFKSKKQNKINGSQSPGPPYELIGRFAALSKNQNKWITVPWTTLQADRPLCGLIQKEK